MIDVENEIYTKIVTEVRKEFPKINTSGSTVLAPSSYPALCVDETNNTTYTRAMDSAGEYCSEISYEISTFSNKKSGSKAEAKAIMAIVDRVMGSLNFTRRACVPVYDDPTRYRLTSRYIGVVSQNKELFVR